MDSLANTTSGHDERAEVRLVNFKSISFILQDPTIVAIVPEIANWHYWNREKVACSVSHYRSHHSVIILHQSRERCLRHMKRQKRIDMKLRLM